MGYYLGSRVMRRLARRHGKLEALRILPGAFLTVAEAHLSHLAARINTDR
jgi:hypothetical protein